MTGPKFSLRRRITLAYTIYALSFVLFFAAIATYAVEGIEHHLVDGRLREAASWAVPRYAAGMSVEMPAGLNFHQGDAIPQSLKHLMPGMHDIEVDGIGLHILVGMSAAGKYMIIDHQSDYDKVERSVYGLFGTSFIGFIAFSFLLAGYVVRGVVKPLTSLATAVADGKTIPSSEGPPEVDILAEAFAVRTAALQQALRRERFFTGDVSHELRSALTVIMGAAEVLQAQGSDSAAYAPSERIYRAAREAGQLSGVLLLLARAPAPEACEEVDIGQLAQEEVSRYQHLVSRKPVTLSCEIEAPLKVRAPRELCATAIGNLIRNAAQYTEEGSVVVHVDQLGVTIDDSGPGLPDAVSAALAGDAAPPSTGSAGSGLGLGLVQRICEYLGAEFSAAPGVEGGTRFAIRFTS